MPMCVIVGPMPDVTNTDNDIQFPGVATTTFTFTSKAIGTADPSRFVIVAMSDIDTAARTATMTIGGVSATEFAGCAARTASGASTEVQVRMFGASVPTGTTATIVVTISTGGATGCGIGVWSATNLASTTPTATSNDLVDPLNLNLNVSANGVVAGYAFQGVPVTWTGLTEDFDSLILGLQHSGASTAQAVAASPRTVTCAVTTGSSTGGVGCAASFR